MNMKILISLLFCGLTAAAVNDINMAKDIPSAQLEGMGPLLSSFKTLMASDDYPAYAFDAFVDPTPCFAYYTPKSIEISTTYQDELGVCTETANDARDAQALLNAKKRDDLTNTGKEISKDLEDCESFTDIFEFLKCFKETSAASSEKLYKSSQDSSSTLSVVAMKDQEIENTNRQCSETALVKYNTDMFNNEKAKASCISGESKPPTDESTTSTTTEEVTEEITEATSEVTEEPTEATDEPTEETDEPTEETDEPTEETDEPTEETDEPTEETEEPTEETEEPETDEPETEPERSPEEDIYRMNRNAQGRRNILKNLLH